MGIQEQVVVVVMGDYQDEMRCLRKKILIRDEGGLVCWESRWYGEFVADTPG